MIIREKLTKLIGIFSENSSYEDLEEKCEKRKQGFSKMKKSEASFNLRDLEKCNSLNLKSGLKCEYLYKVCSFEELGYESYDKFSLRQIYSDTKYNIKEGLSFEEHATKVKKFVSELPFDLLINHEDIRTNKINLPLKKDPKKKKTLLIDLDETLIHSDIKNNYRNHDTTLYLEDNYNYIKEIPIFKRPGLAKFLKFAATYFEVGVFTASTKEYADCILDHLDPNKQIFSFRLYRDSCINVKGVINIKPLSLIEGRNLEDILLIDNNVFSFCTNLSNGYLIPNFYNDKEEKELVRLEEYLTLQK